MGGCELLTAEIIESLADSTECKRIFGCKMPPLGGVLRNEFFPMCDVTPLYYCPASKIFLPEDVKIASGRGGYSERNLSIVLDGDTYYISSH